MKADPRLWRAQAGVAAAVLAGLAGFSALAVALLGAAQRPPPATVATLLVVAALGLAALAAWAVKAWVLRHVIAPARLLERSQVLLATDAVQAVQAPEGTPALQGLAQALNALAGQREALRQDMAQQVAQASRGVAEERNRLAALMSELTQSVVVCNLQGRILLYNGRARAQFRALSAAPQLAGGAELVGLGRSIYTVFDERLVAHALDSLRQRLAQGGAADGAQPSAQFVTVTRGGQLLRVQLAPVRGADAEPGTQAEAVAEPLAGFVLMLADITRAQAQQAAQERLLHSLTEGQRGALANLQTAVQMLDDPELPPPLRERFLSVVREEAQALGQRLQQAAGQGEQALAESRHWPLEDMRAADLVQAARQRIEAATGLRTGVLAQDEALWLRVDSYALLQALVYLAGRLHDEFGLKAVQLRVSPQAARETAAGQPPTPPTPPQRAHACLDLAWTGQAMSTETVMGWELDDLAGPGAPPQNLSVREVVQRHGGEFWFERDRVGQLGFFRFLLPQAVPEDAPTEGRKPSDTASAAARPEYYDFDLFAPSERSDALDEQRLSALRFTVFDTETTGLNPSGGDEIIQIGAVRVVNGRLLRGEVMDQLVNPRRLVPEAGVAIHGITQTMLAGQPAIAQVLPAFHAFAHDTVLVAHNAAFDMRFLQLKEAETGLRFDQPVLDTLLLSAAVHPQQESHSLEAIAQRLGVAVAGRHNALADALVTAEVFLKLVSLLAEQGIHTLGQAREAAQKTYLARLKY